MGRSLADFPPMPLPQQQWAHRIPNPLLQAEQYDVDEMATLVDEQKAIFNLDQAAAFDAILVMNIEWDYSYYQPWSDNKQLVDEMIAMREETLMVQNENITMQ